MEEELTTVLSSLSPLRPGQPRAPKRCSCVLSRLSSIKGKRKPMGGLFGKLKLAFGLRNICGDFPGWRSG